MDIPDDIIYKISQHLNIVSCYNYILTNKNIYLICKDNLWVKQRDKFMLKYFMSRFKKRILMDQIINFIQDCVKDRIINN